MPTDTLPAAVSNFLTWARDNGGHAEFINDVIQPRPIDSLAHTTICGNLFAALHAGADGIDRHVFQNVLVEMPGIGFLRPDIIFGMWTLDGEEVHVRGPRLVIEVMAPTTAAQDRGLKWKAFQRMASLERYVLVDEVEWSVEVFSRGLDDTWKYERLNGVEDFLTMPSIGFAMPLTAVYRGVFRT